MPIYEYVCNACGHEFEEWQKISDVPVQKCPVCSERKVERLVSLSTFHLKGTGWYVTDYAGKKSNGETSKRTSSESKKSSTSTSSESKTEKKSESKAD